VAVGRWCHDAANELYVRVDRRWHVESRRFFQIERGTVRVQVPNAVPLVAFKAQDVTTIETPVATDGTSPGKVARPTLSPDLKR
jgi:hypothetical protein